MQILKSKYILPITSESLENCCIVIDGGKIKEIISLEDQKKKYSDFPVKDFGDSVIMPGFVNVHCHAEYTVMRGLIGCTHFFDWITKLTKYHEFMTRDEFMISAELGVLRMLSSGITTIADSACYGTTLEVIVKLGLKGIVYQEVFGPDDRYNHDALEDLKRKVETLQEKTSGTNIVVGVSPHSVYTVSESLFRKVCVYAAKNKLPVSIHAAETLEEQDFVGNGTGIIAERYKIRGIKWYGKNKTVVEYLRDIGLFDTGARIQLVHLTQASERDLEIIEKYKLSAALCPCSNSWLAVGFSPISGIIEYGIFAGLGTDSMASNGDLSMFDEMHYGVYSERGKSRNVESVSTDQILELATFQGAKSIYMSDMVGSIEPGKAADLIAVSLDKLSAVHKSNLIDYIVLSCKSSDVFMTMIDGKIFFENGKFSYFDESEIIEKGKEIMTKLVDRKL